MDISESKLCYRLRITHVRPMATEMSCSATEKPSLYALLLPLVDSVAKLQKPPFSQTTSKRQKH
jgi:hypothetical protein